MQPAVAAVPGDTHQLMFVTTRAAGLDPQAAVAQDQQAQEQQPQQPQRQPQQRRAQQPKAAAEGQPRQQRWHPIEHRRPPAVDVQQEDDPFAIVDGLERKRDRLGRAAVGVNGLLGIFGDDVGLVAAGASNAPHLLVEAAIDAL